MEQANQKTISNALTLCDSICYAISTNRQTGSTAGLLSIDNACLVCADKREVHWCKHQKRDAQAISLADLHDRSKLQGRTKLVFDNYAIYTLANICQHALRAKRIEPSSALYTDLGIIADYLQDISRANWIVRLKWLLFGFKLPNKVLDAFNRLDRQVYDATAWY